MRFFICTLVTIFTVAAFAQDHSVMPPKAGQDYVIKTRKSDNTVQEMFRAMVTENLLGVPNLTDLSGTGPVDFPQGVQADSVASRNGTDPVEFPQGVRSDSVVSQNGTDPVSLTSGAEFDSLKSQNGSDPVVLSSPLRIQDGSEGSAGDVLTSTDANGTAQWQSIDTGGGCAFQGNLNLSYNLTGGSGFSSIVTESVSIESGEWVFVSAFIVIELDNSNHTVQMEFRVLDSSGSEVDSSPIADHFIAQSGNNNTIPVSHGFSVFSNDTYDIELRVKSSSDGIVREAPVNGHCHST